MLLHGPPARLNVTRRHFHSLLNAVDTITAASPRSSTSSSVEFWILVLLQSDLVLRRHRFCIFAASLADDRERTNRNTASSTEGTELSANVSTTRGRHIASWRRGWQPVWSWAVGKRLWKRLKRTRGNKEERTLPVTFTRGDGDKVVHRRTPSVCSQCSSPCSVCVQHCNGIQALRIHSGNLYSASRDSTIK